MKSVEPIRDKKKIDAMKAILASGKYGQRNLVAMKEQKNGQTQFGLHFEQIAKSDS